MDKEVFKLVVGWADRTDWLLEQNLNKKDIGVSDALRRSKSNKVRELTNGIIEAEFTMLARGRFVDMGAGRPRKVESRDTNRDLLSERKPKKWFNRTFYGRLNALQGIVGASMQETALNAVLDGLIE